jgi:hypothetical protein
MLACFGVKMVSEPQVVWPGQVPTFSQNLVASDWLSSLVNGKVISI